MAVEQAEQVNHGSHRLRVSTFISGEGVFTAACQLCSFDLGEFQFFADAGQLGCFRGIHPVTKSKPSGFFGRIVIKHAFGAMTAERPTVIRNKAVTFVFLGYGFDAVAQRSCPAHRTRLLIPFEAFRRLTGVPMVLNTSFNENEPVVCRPEEALDCFLRTRMDLLVMGDWMVERGG